MTCECMHYQLVQEALDKLTSPPDLRTTSPLAWNIGIEMSLSTDFEASKILAAFSACFEEGCVDGWGTTTQGKQRYR